MVKQPASNDEELDDCCSFLPLVQRAPRLTDDWPRACKKKKKQQTCILTVLPSHLVKTDTLAVAPVPSDAGSFETCVRHIAVPAPVGDLQRSRE